MNRQPQLEALLRTLDYEARHIYCQSNSSTVRTDGLLYRSVRSLAGLLLDGGVSTL